MRISDTVVLTEHRITLLCCFLICLIVSDFQTVLAADTKHVLLDTPISDRIKAIEKKQKKLNKEIISVHGSNTGKVLSTNTKYQAAIVKAREHATRFHSQIASKLSLSSKETKQYLTIIESAQKAREIDINHALVYGMDNFLSTLDLIGLKRSKPALLSPRDTSLEIKKLLGDTRFDRYHNIREQLFEEKVVIAADDVTLDCNNHIIINDNWLNNAPGISISGRSNVTLHDCIVHFFDIGIFIEDSTNIHVENTEAMGGVGYRVEDSVNVDLVRNTALQNVNEGFAVRRSSATFFWENSAVRNSGDGFDENNGDNAYYLRNDSFDNGTNGFELDAAPSPTYWQNWVFVNGQHGISLDAVDTALVHDNDIIGSGEDGLRLDDEPVAGVNTGTVNSTVTDNYSTGNGDRAAHQCGSICTGNVYTNNLFEGPTNNLP